MSTLTEALNGMVRHGVSRSPVILHGATSSTQTPNKAVEATPLRSVPHLERSAKNMSTPPPLPTSSSLNTQSKKKNGCTKGCLLTGVIGFVILVGFAFVSNIVSENEWKKNRGEVLASIQQSLEEGNYLRAFSLAAPHKSRNDDDLKKLILKAESLKRETEERIRQERIAQLVIEIKNAKGADRIVKLNQLLSIDPNTKEFSDEIAKIREHQKMLKSEASEFVANGTGSKVPYKKWNIYGTPENLDETDNKYWVAYLPNIDVSFVSDKASDKVIFVGRGKTSAPDYLTNKNAARRKQIESGFSGWDGSHRGLTRVIKESMNDPKSYEHAETVHWDMGDHLVVRTTFRGRNAFGGMVRNWVKAKVDLDGNVLEIIERGP
ncbi:MAG: hypothetical protein QM627_07490 [Luteolibacter sp.]